MPFTHENGAAIAIEEIRRGTAADLHLRTLEWHLARCAFHMKEIMSGGDERGEWSWIRTQGNPGYTVHCEETILKRFWGDGMGERERDDDGLGPVSENMGNGEFSWSCKHNGWDECWKWVCHVCMANELM